MELKMRLAAVTMALLLLALLFLGVPPASSEDQTLITSVEGTVTDAETGEPLQSVEVYLWNEKGNPGHVSWDYTVTDSQGHYLFNMSFGGVYYITVSPEGYEDGYAEVDLDIGDNEVVDFQLYPLSLTCAVYGLIYDSETGEPIMGTVYLTDMEDGDRLNAKVGEDGRFHFDVETGVYKLEVHVNDKYERYEGEVFKLEDGDEREMNISFERHKQGIYGIVTDTEGNPIAIGEISIENNEWRASVSLDENGEYIIMAPSGMYLVKANCNSYKPYEGEAEITDNELIMHDIQLENAVVHSIITQILRAILNLIGAL